MIRIFITALLHLMSSFTQAQENQTIKTDEVVVSAELFSQETQGYVIQVDAWRDGLDSRLFERSVEKKFYMTAIHADKSLQAYGNDHLIKGLVFRGNHHRFKPIEFDVKDKDLTFEIGF